MIAFRWICLGCFLLGLAGCGAGSDDASTDPAGAQVRQERLDRVEQLKAKSARKPGR